MSERRNEFGTADIAVITFTDPERLAAYIDHLGVSFPVVTDVDRTLYRALGVERGSLRQVWSVGTLQTYWSLLRAGRRLRRTHGDDVRQLGADVIVDADGTIRTLFRPTSPDKRPSVDELLAALP